MNRLEAAIDRVEITHVGNETERVRSESLQRGHSVVDLLLLPTRNGDTRAMRGERLGDSAVDPARATHDDDRLSGEVQIGHELFLRSREDT